MTITSCDFLLVGRGKGLGLLGSWVGSVRVSESVGRVEWGLGVFRGGLW